MLKIQKKVCESLINGNLRGKFNILWVIDHLGYGEIMHGPGKYCLNMLPMFDRDKFNLSLCVLRGVPHLHKSLEEQGFRVYYLGKGRFNFFTLGYLLKIIKSEKINLLHLHQYGSANFGRLAGRLKGIPAIVGAYDEDPYYRWYQALSDLVLSKYTCNAIAVSEAVKQSCIKKRKIPADKVLVIHTGIPPEQFEEPKREECIRTKKKYGLEPDHFVVGTLSRLREEKGVRYLIEAAAEVLQVFPKIYFFIAGDGPLLEELKAIADRLGIRDRVIFAGFCKNARAILSIFDIKVLASLSEGFSAAIQEAMAMRKPIVATTVGGTTEMLQDGITGLLVPPKDPHAIAEKIIYLLQHKEERERLGKRAYQECRKWGLDVLVKEIEKVYEEALTVNRPAACLLSKS